MHRDQWCYLPNDDDAFAEGMRIPANVLDRTGYRLPTEAEWEYACRAGTATSRYHGLSTELLAEYARYHANSDDHAWPGGDRLPNDLGLFDMLGNVYEWCHDREGTLRPSRKGRFSDMTTTAEVVVNKNVRILRGGDFYVPSADARSARHAGDAPSFESTNVGFRVARTLTPRQ